MTVEGLEGVALDKDVFSLLLPLDVIFVEDFESIRSMGWMFVGNKRNLRTGERQLAARPSARNRSSQCCRTRRPVSRLR